MKKMPRFALGAVVVAALLGLGGCWAEMSTPGKNAAIGPIEGGEPGKTQMIGGPTIGGIVGHETEKPK